MANVIVADNDVLIRDILRSALTSIGQTVFLAASGVEALEFAQRLTVAVIILDLDMPRMNGLQACERLRAMPKYMDTPIVILTSHDQYKVKKAVAQVGATIFLTKPFQIGGLLQCLAPYLNAGAQRQRELPRTSLPAAGGTAAGNMRERPGGEPDPATAGKTGPLDRGLEIIEAYRPNSAGRLTR